MFEHKHKTRYTQTQSSRSVSPARPSRTLPHLAHTETPLLVQQQSLGNQVVQRLLNSRVIQTKLTINEPGDKYEQEADRVAEQVTRMPHPGVLKEAAVPEQDESIHIQRMCPECEEELHRQPIEEEVVEEEEDIVPDETGMPKRKGGTPDRPSSEISAIRVPRGGGHALEPKVRSFMERRIGRDFGRVHVHTDAAAVKSARQLKAHAYTVGQDIYFNEGQYDPVSFKGRRLLAHELTHVVQQTGRGEVGRNSVQMQPTRQRRGTRCVNTCAAGGCPQGKQSRVVRDDCSTGPPTDRTRYITDLNVSLSDRKVRVVWSRGDPEEWPCTPNPSATPTGRDKVGVKCSVDHTNRNNDGMAWFTGFEKQYLRIGFHNSQPVGPGCVSHGCVRVCCDKAEIINRNTWSGRTRISVT